jgi:hypothetical protein
LHKVASDDQKSGVIEVRIRELAQLFNSFDPSPFHDRDLDQDAEEHIVGWARELPVNVPLTIVIHLPEAEALKAQQRDLPQAMRHYFDVRADRLRGDLKELFRLGRHYLLIGLSILIVCLLASQFAESYLGPGPLAKTVEESLIIVGWVANWKPLETFLYDWWPVKRRLDLYRRLAAADVRITATP